MKGQGCDCFFRSRHRVSARMSPPATNPQNAPLMPKKLKPEAVTTKVTTAASRSSTLATAPIIDAASAPSSARPATAWIRIGGEAAMKAVASAGQQAEHEIGDAGHDRGPVAARRIGMRVGAGAQGRGDGGEVDRMAAERRRQPASRGRWCGTAGSGSGR